MLRGKAAQCRFTHEQSATASTARQANAMPHWVSQECATANQHRRLSRPVHPAVKHRSAACRLKAVQFAIAVGDWCLELAKHRSSSAVSQRSKTCCIYVLSCESGEQHGRACRYLEQYVATAAEIDVTIQIRAFARAYVSQPWSWKQATKCVQHNGWQACRYFRPLPSASLYHLANLPGNAFVFLRGPSVSKTIVQTATCPEELQRLSW